jgi:molybdopterin molybdotransferase
MPEFLKLVSVDEARGALLAGISALADEEQQLTEQALGRVTAQAIVSPANSPSFRRSEVDGYALRSRDTHAASASLPAYLSLAGEVLMGRAAGFALCAGQAALIHTGGHVPDGADAVVMVEDTQVSRPGEIEVLRALSPGENVLEVGEDVKVGQVVLGAHVRLRAQEIGALMGLGITRIALVRRPRVAILATGDEVVPPEAAPSAGQVRDVNSYVVEAIVRRAGGEPKRFGILGDDEAALRQAARQALDECDALVITAGSSVSTRDMTERVANDLGPPGVIVHGIATKPGKPTILALAGRKPVLGLPGNPVSAAVIAMLYAAPMVEKMLGLDPAARVAGVRARITRNLPSLTGREDYIPGRWIGRAGGIWVDPIFGKSNLIFTLVRADGLIRLPADVNGVAEADWVDFLPFSTANPA